MRLTPLLLLLSLPAGAAMAQDPIANPRDFVSPGYWETTSKLTSPFQSEKTEKRCVTPADVIKFMEPCNHHYNCEYSVRHISDGHIVLKGQWVGKKDGQVVDVAGTGTYTSDTLHATAKMHTRLLGLPLSGEATSDARRLGAVCPPGSEKH